MRRVLTLLSFLFLLAAPASADDLQVIIELAPDQSVAIGDQELVAGFDGVTEFDGRPMDSRCAASVICVWAGDAWMEVWAEVPGQERVEVTLHTHPMQGPQEFEVGGYLISLLILEPYPLVPSPIPAEDYRVHLIVSGSGRVADELWSPGMLKARYGKTSG